VRHSPEALAVQVEIHRGRAEWNPMQAIARRLAHTNPADPQWAISWAYATRRAESLEAARAILLEAADRYPKEAIIPYNLACYECRLGHLEAAMAYLKAAFKLQPKCKAMALEDEDLSPLWAEVKYSRAS
jgi:tetratricopeptide (TPR) repeat protein